VSAFHPLRYVYDPTAQTFDGFITILNNTAQDITGKITISFPALPAGVTLVNANAGTAANPEIVLTGDVIPADSTLRVFIELADPLLVPLSTFNLDFPIDVITK